MTQMEWISDNDVFQMFSRYDNKNINKTLFLFFPKETLLISSVDPPPHIHILPIAWCAKRRKDLENPRVG